MNAAPSSKHVRAVLMSAAALGALASGLAGKAAAQASPQSGADGPSNASSVGEVVVTARHRLESLQSVPIAISVVDGAQAASKNLNDIQDISAQVPAVDFRTSASNKDQTIFVRGIGTISTSPGVEPSVSTVIDGVVLARAGEATLDLLDLDHIEVLRGPQGTLFGKNASAGVINIVTRSPTATPQGYLDASYFEGDEYRLGAGLSGPLLGDQLEGLLTAFYGHYDGNVKNVFLNQTVNGYDDDGLRGKLIARPTSALTLTIGADYTRSLETIPTGVWATTDRVAYPTGAVSNYPGFASLLAQEGVAAGPDNRTISSDDKSSAHDDQGGLSVQADWDIGGGYRVTSITGFRDWYNVQRQDYDQLSTATPVYPAVGDIGHLNFDQTSEELRIASPKGPFVDYVAGFYYLNAVDRERYERDVDTIGGAANGLNDGVGHYGSTDDNYAVFGEANLNFTKSLRAILGVRDVWDDLSFYNDRVSTSATAVTGVQPTFAAAGSETKNGQAGRAGVQYDVTSAVMVYATYSHGYKGPAYNVFFNEIAAEVPPLKPETSNAYEVGLKGRFFDQKLQADLSAFRTVFSNFQANSTFLVDGALVTNLINAGTVRSEGFEADLTGKPVHGLTLDLNALYDDASVVSFPCPAGSPASCDINGKPLPFAPRYKLHAQGDYRRPLTSVLDVDIETDYNWQSSTQYQLSETPLTVQPAYGIWNASVAVLNPHDGWTLRLLVKNIANQSYSSYLATGNEGSTGVVRWVPRDDHRYFGVNLHKDF